MTVNTAEAQIFRIFGIFKQSTRYSNVRYVRYNNSVRQYQKTSYTISYETIIDQTIKNQDVQYKSTAILARQKAELLARHKSVYHPGGGFGAGFYEGVAMGSTEKSAITSCCYWGSKKPIAIGVARSENGLWYATVIYK